MCKYKINFGKYANWFRNYKFARKGTKATFALNGKPGNKILAEKIIKQGNEHWLAYLSKKNWNFNLL